MVMNVVEVFKEFDDENVIKQIILIGVNGKIKNIEFTLEEEE